MRSARGVDLKSRLISTGFALLLSAKRCNVATQNGPRKIRLGLYLSLINF
jgi:hypothetical protein